MAGRMRVPWLFGGRPMSPDADSLGLHLAFTDSVSGEAVYYWRDRLGRRWLANGAWSLFRVPRSEKKQS